MVAVKTNEVKGLTVERSDTKISKIRRERRKSGREGKYKEIKKKIEKHD